MKFTGRRLTLSNDITSLAPPKSITSGDYRLTTIFEDDRANYAWKIVDIKQFGPAVVPGANRPVNWALMSVRPESFFDAPEFGNWAANRQPFDNSLIGTYNIEWGNGEPYSLRVDHVATNHLSLF